jgi:glycine cleavage system transcriptional repressor
MAETDAGQAAVEAWLAPVVRGLGLRVHVDAIEGRLHEHLAPNARVTVHGADRPGIVARVTAALAAAGFNILDLDSDVGGTAEHPIYVMVLDGVAADGIEALDRAVAPLRASGMELRVSAIDTLVG